MKIISFFAFLLFTFFSLNAQNKQTHKDTLLKIISEKDSPDTAKIQALCELCYSIKLNYTDSAKKFGLEAVRISEKINNIRGMGSSYNNVGLIYRIQGNYEKSIEYTLKAIKYLNMAGMQVPQAKAYGNLGTVYMYRAQTTNSKLDYDMSEKYLKISKKMFSELNNFEGMMGGAINLAGIYFESGQIEKAYTENLEALKMAQEKNIVPAIGLIYNNLGNYFSRKNNTKEALKNYMEALKIREQMGQKQSIALTLGNIAGVYAEAGDRKLSIEYSLKALELSKELGAIDLQKESYSHLYDVYDDMGDCVNALKFYKLYNAVKDSLVNEENSKQVYELEAVYQNERKEKELVLKNTEIAVKDAENKSTSAQRNLFIIGFAGMILLTLLVFRNYKQKKKANLLLEQQKTEIQTQKSVIEEKNHEIIDSITYAKRLQEAILPSQKLVNEYFKESFVLFKPKDIVAGDFYWLETKGDLVFFAVADCTGHGVPGALVSVVCSNALNRAVKEFGIIDPGKILDKVRDLVIETFEKSSNEVKDGMDISFCAINNKTKELNWAGANNPVWYIKSGSDKITEIKGDKMPIGKFSEQKPFTTHNIQMSGGDKIYIFTDGYVDQFGGAKGKKFKVKQLNDLVMANHNKSFSEQKEIINSAFEGWKKNLEQVDDICIIGIKI